MRHRNTTRLIMIAVGLVGCSSSGATGDVPGSWDATAEETSLDSAQEAAIDSGDPAETSAESGGDKTVGGPCTPGDNCPAGGSGSPVCLDWPGGYCAVGGCTTHGHDCPGDPGQGGTSTAGSKCVLAPQSICLKLCVSTADCRAGYTCADKSDAAGHGSAKVCFPS